MTPGRKATSIARRLAALEPRTLRADELAAATGGGETASTSTSGTPAAGDDTVGDRGGINNLRQLPLASH